MKRTLTLLTLAALLLVGCNDTVDAGSTLPADSTTAATTIDRDTLTDPNLTNQQIAFRNAVWATVKDNIGEDFSINNLNVSKFVVQLDDAFVGFHYGYVGNGGTTTSAPMIYTETVGEYDFIFSSTPSLQVFANGESYSLQNAYSAGVLTDDQLRTVWEAYKAEYSELYD